MQEARSEVLKILSSEMGLSAVFCTKLGLKEKRMVVLAAIQNRASPGHLRRCSMAHTTAKRMNHNPLLFIDEYEHCTSAKIANISFITFYILTNRPSSLVFASQESAGGKAQLT
jgi:hypothetical protein